MQHKSLGRRLVLLTMAIVLGFSGGVGLFHISRALGYDLSNGATALAEASQTLDKSSIRILYLTANEVPELQSLAKADNVVTSSDVRFATELNSVTPLDVLMFDSALKNKLDQAWVRQRYSQGIAVVGVNVSIVDLAEFVGDQDAASSWANAVTPTSNFYSMLQLYVTGDNPEEVERWKQESHNLLNEDGTYRSMEGVTSHLSISGSRAQVAISDLKSLALVYKSIRSAAFDTTP